MAIAAKFLLTFLIFFVVSGVVFNFSVDGSVRQELTLMVGRFCGVGAIISVMYWIWSY